MMITKTGGVTPLQMHCTQAEGLDGAAGRARQYDRVELTTTQYTQEQRFARELAGRIAQEVRTQQSEQVPRLREQVEAGTYRYSIYELAVQILLFGGAGG